MTSSSTCKLTIALLTPMPNNKMWKKIQSSKFWKIINAPSQTDNAVIFKHEVRIKATHFLSWVCFLKNLTDSLQENEQPLNNYSNHCPAFMPFSEIKVLPKTPPSMRTKKESFPTSKNGQCCHHCCAAISGHKFLSLWQNVSLVSNVHHVTEPESKWLMAANDRQEIKVSLGQTEFCPISDLSCDQSEGQ